MEEITDYYLLKHSAARATKVILSLEDAFDKIASSPFIYPVCFDIKQPVEDIRQIIVHSTFKVVYRVKKDKIEVLEIFHGKRNPGLLREADFTK